MKTMTVVTKAFKVGEAELDSTPEIAIITITENDYRVMRKYVDSMETMIDNGLRPSTLNTYQGPSFAFYYFGWDRLPLITGQLPENTVFVTSELEKEFYESFNEAPANFAEEQEGTLLSELEFENSTDCDRMFIKNDLGVFFSSFLKYTDTTFEAEAFSVDFINQTLTPFFNSDT